MSQSEANIRRDRLLGFLAQDPGNAHLIAELVDLDLHLGLLSEAECHLQQGLAVAPNEPQLIFQKASLALRSGAVEEAEQLYRKLFEELGVDAPGIRYSLAYTLMLKAQYAEVKALLQPIIDHADTPGATALYIRCLHFLGELEEAIKIAEQYVSEHPADAEVLGALSLLYTDLDDMAKAGEWAQRALQVDPNNTEGLITQGTIDLGQEETEKAIAGFQRAVELKPSSGRAWVGLGLSEMLNLNLDAAKVHLAKATEHLPTHIGTWHARAWNYIVTNDIPAAKSCFLKALELDRNFAETHGGLAVIAVIEGRHQDAEREVQLGLKLDPHCYSALYAKTLLMSRAGHGKVAAKLIENVLTTTPVPGGGTLADMLKRVASKRTPH